jgi:hypothetical protein
MSHTCPKAPVCAVLVNLSAGWVVLPCWLAWLFAFLGWLPRRALLACSAGLKDVLRVSHMTTQLWSSEGSSHVVAQAEMLPTLVAKETWKSVLEDAWIIHFVDNDSVKAALVTGHTKSKASAALVDIACHQEAVAMSRTWYSRVPSPSNVADGPSRLEYSSMCEWNNASGSKPLIPSGLSGCEWCDASVSVPLRLSRHAGCDSSQC